MGVKMEYKIKNVYEISLKETKEQPLSLLEEKVFDGGTSIKYWM